MKSYDELTKDLLERRDRYEALQKQKKQKIKRIATPLCCFVLVGLLVLGVWQGGLHQAVTPVQPNGAVSQPIGSQPSSHEENHPSVPSVVSKESQAEKSSAPAKVSKPDSSSLGITDSSVTSKEDSSDKLEAQEQQDAATMIPGATPQKPVPTFRIERPRPGFLVQSESDTFGDAMADADGRDPCRFANLKGFHNWLEKGGEEEILRKNILKYFSKGSPTLTLTSYYRPQLGDGKNGWQLTNINVYYEELYYNYTMFIGEVKTHLGIYIGIDKDRIEHYTYEMQRCSELINGPVENYYPLFDRYGSVTVKGVEYTCYYFPKDKVTSVYWKTNGITFCAVYDGEYADVGKILPLLGMERVGYKVVK